MAPAHRSKKWPSSLAGALNANIGGREHAAVYVERQVIDWARQLFRLPDTASGILVSGTSIETVLAGGGPSGSRWWRGSAARDCMTGVPGSSATPRARRTGCVARAFELLGLGPAAVCGSCLPMPSTPWTWRRLPHSGSMRIAPLAAVIMSLGVPVPSIPGRSTRSDAIADICVEQRLRFHADAAFGGLALRVPELAPRLAGIERADRSRLRFPQMAACALRRGLRTGGDERLHRAAFALRPDYLAAAERGLAVGNPGFTITASISAAAFARQGLVHAADLRP